ncbi:TIGR00159 family protein [Nonlabens sp. Hel1_33_55]|uniref:diadenylate cyclase CdaA n=1 Tax=Nonlabens sp. Hel1_33_55 TaxID=1336802 RepID=UPI000875E099|nr:diadenylate cyclase CdaA [Nonlabens sp. Hel1_33_55]SCX88058.1 TIGR00159 family protein [Nonlabens sp. Hel1_33_55]
MELPAFRIIDLVDIVLFAALIFYLYRLVKGTAAINIFIGIVIIYLIYEITLFLKMEMLSRALGAFTGAGVFALIVVFQQELRRFLLMLGSTQFTSKRRFLRQLRFFKEDIDTNSGVVEEVVTACKRMSATKTGALIAIKRDGSLDFLKNSGDTMDIVVNAPIIQSIFYKNSTLHDGAMIIEGNKITATRVILPVSDNRKIPQRFGLRHRAALGLTERSNAMAIIVSEETGQVSLVMDGAFESYEDMDDLADKIKTHLD